MRLPWARREPERREIEPLSWDDYLSFFTHDGVEHLLTGLQTSPGQNEEQVAENFAGLSQGALKTSGAIFSCVATRVMHFQQARFQFRRITNGRPGDYFGTAELAPLENPWPGGTTSDLMARMLVDVDLAGNAYVVRRPPPPGGGTATLRRLRPDWTRIVAGARSEKAAIWDPDVQILGYAYQPGGPSGGLPWQTFAAEDVCHFAWMPDPEAAFLGMSWITPVIQELRGDKAAMRHKLKFFENGATPNMVVTLPIKDVDAFNRWVEEFRERQEGLASAYKTLFFASGADVTSVGANMRQIDFAITQGHGETRIAAAAQVPPVIVGLSEGLSAATYSNYSQARRRFADGTLRPLWGNAASSLQTLIVMPDQARAGPSVLAYDDRDIAFLREDADLAATILVKEASAVKLMTDAGFTADSAVKATSSRDISLLQHSGLFSVQLQPAGTTNGSASTNGSGVPSAPPNGGVAAAAMTIAEQILRDLELTEEEGEEDASDTAA